MLQTSSEHSAPSSLCQQGRKATALSPQEPATGCFSWQEWRVFGARCSEQISGSLLIVWQSVTLETLRWEVTLDAKSMQFALCLCFIYCALRPQEGAAPNYKKI